MSKLPKEENRVSGLWRSRLCYWLFKVLKYFWSFITALVPSVIASILLLEGIQLPRAVFITLEPVLLSEKADSHNE